MQQAKATPILLRPSSSPLWQYTVDFFPSKFATIATLQQLLLSVQHAPDDGAPDVVVVLCASDLSLEWSCAVVLLCS